MWTCECGCQAIAADLPFCPQCFKERDMPKTTTEGGGSNAAEDTAEPVSADAAAAEEAAVAAEPVVLKVELKEQARDLGLPVSGTKAQLAEAVAAVAEPEVSTEK